MGISFKVSRTGKRFNPIPPDKPSFPVEDEEVNDVSKKPSESISCTRKLGETNENNGIGRIAENPDGEVSFCLNLFKDGYSIGKPMESESGCQTSVDVSRILHPYDRASEALFSAIESGRLPGDILDDIPCKYVNGALVCEVRDYRKCSSEGHSMASVDSSLVINRVCLRMSLENIVKDISSISDNDWTYGDLMEVESRILKALQPQLTLDPNPQLERLYNNSTPTKLNLEVHTMRMKRLRQIPEVAVTSNNLQGKKVCLNRVPEASVSLGQQTAYENLNIQSTSNMLPQRNNNSFGSEGSLLKYQIGVANNRMMIPFADNNSSASVHGKRDNQDGQSSPLMNKRTRLEGNLLDNFNGSELQWKNTLLHHHQQQQQQSIGRGIQYGGNNGMQKISQQVFDGGLNQEGGPMPFTIGPQGIRYSLKEEPGLSQSSWNNIGQNLDSNNNPRREDPYQKRKFVQSPHVSAGGGLPQSPLSSRSGDFSSGSHQFGAVVSSGNTTQKERSVGGNDSMQRSNQTKRKSKMPIMSGVGSPVSVSNMIFPLSASSPPIGSQPLSDQIMLGKFSKIETVTMRYQLNRKNIKIEEYPRKPNSYDTQRLLVCLSNDSNSDNLKDEEFMLSKSLIGGNMNNSKTRILNFTQTERIIQGNSFQLVTKARTKMIMSEKPNSGTVAFHIGEIGDAEYTEAEEYLPTLPNTHIADLLAAQFSSLMEREGYDVEDKLQPKEAGIPHTPEIQQPFSEGVSVQPSNTNNNPPQLNSTHNIQHVQSRMLPPGNNNHLVQVSQPLLPTGVSMSEQQQMRLPPPQHMHQMGPHMGNKHSPLQLQIQQQRKLMGSIGNSIVGLGGGMGGTRISAPMGPTGIGNLSNSVDFASAVRNGTISQEQATLMKMRMQQNRSNMSNMIPASRQMQLMLGQAALNRTSINSQMMQQQRTAMGQMGPPKLMNMYMNPMQMQQQQMQMQQQQMQMQQETRVVSPPQVGSPSQSQQRTPMSPQLSSGGVHGMNAEAGPGSPQLSSQTMGSVGSMANSPMEMPGVNKGNGQ